MRGFIERRLGIYWGIHTLWNLPVPRPALYVVINLINEDAAVRLEFGGRRRTFWIDW